VLSYRASVSSLQEQASSCSHIPCINVDFALCSSQEDCALFSPVVLSAERSPRRCALKLPLHGNLRLRAPGMHISGYQPTICWLSSLSNCPDKPLIAGVSSCNVQRLYVHCGALTLKCPTLPACLLQHC
jgi:hypothetical protein